MFLIKFQEYFAKMYSCSRALIQIEEKTHVPETIHFPDYVFNENTHSMYCFHEWDISLILIHPFYDRHKN